MAADNVIDSSLFEASDILMIIGLIMVIPQNVQGEFPPE